MSDQSFQYNVHAAIEDRSHAVGLALELIKAHAVGSHAAQSGILSFDMEKLSEYADKIQAALKK